MRCLHYGRHDATFNAYLYPFLVETKLLLTTFYQLLSTFFIILILPNLDGKLF